MTGARTAPAPADADGKTRAGRAHMGRKDFGEQQIVPADCRVGEETGDGDGAREHREVGRAAPEPRNHDRRADQRGDGQRLQSEAGRNQSENRHAGGAPHIGPGQHSGRGLRRKAHVDDQFRNPLDDEVEARHVREITQCDEHRCEDQARFENIGDRALPRFRRIHRERVDRLVTEALQNAVDRRQRARLALPVEKLHGFGEQEPHDGNEDRRNYAAEDEDLMPCTAGQQLVHHRAADDSSDGIPDHHQRNGQAAPALIGQFRGGCIDGREHASDSKTGQQSPREQRGNAVGETRAEHAEAHRKKTREDGRAPPDHVGYSAEHHRAQPHAYQFHREDPAERGLVYPPVFRNSGRREADGQNIEAIHGIEPRGDQDREPLTGAHGAVIDDRLGVDAFQ